MKRILPLILLVIVISCQPEPKKAIVSGTVIEPVKEYVVFRMDDFRDTAFLDSIGNFRIEIMLEEPAYYSFYNGRERTEIYLAPGYDLSMHLNVSEFDESLQYAGIGEAPNNYLASSFLLDKTLATGGKELFIKDEDVFLEYIDSVKMVRKDFLNKSGLDTVSLRDFLDLEHTRIHYYWALNRMNYPSYHKYYSKNEEFEESPGYFDFLENISIGDPGYMIVSSYKYFTDRYIGRETYDKYENDEAYQDVPHAYYYAKMAVIDDLINDPDLKVDMMKDVAMDVVNFRGVDDTDSLLSIFYSKCEDTAYINEIKAAVKAWEALAKGNPAPGFSYKDIDGNEVSLSDFKGKFVYIDVWATWCGPCKAETPYFKELVEEYKDKNIVFMGVSVDSDVEAWEKMVKEKEMNWVQLVSEDAWNTKITKDYMIKGIPRFILIDPDGNIVSANAPRPSGKIKEMFEKEGV